MSKITKKVFHSKGFIPSDVYKDVSEYLLEKYYDKKVRDSNTRKTIIIEIIDED